MVEYSIVMRHYNVSEHNVKVGASFKTVPVSLIPFYDILNAANKCLEFCKIQMLPDVF